MEHIPKTLFGTLVAIVGATIILKLDTFSSIQSMIIIFKEKKAQKKEWQFFYFFIKYFFPFQFCAFKSAFRILITPIKKI